MAKRPFSITFAPGAVSADAVATLPIGCPVIGKILSGAIMTSDATTGVITNTPLAPVVDAADIATTKISKASDNTVRLGDAATTLSLLTVTYIPK